MVYYVISGVQYKTYRYTPPQKMLENPKHRTPTRKLLAAMTDLQTEKKGVQPVKHLNRPKRQKEQGL